MDIVRVLRVIEYVGPRNVIEDHMRHVVKGTKPMVNSDPYGKYTITAATIGEFPEILKREDNEPT